jgi:hypothetical protein
MDLGEHSTPQQSVKQREQSSRSHTRDWTTHMRVKKFEKPKNEIWFEDLEILPLPKL